MQVAVKPINNGDRISTGRRWQLDQTGNKEYSAHNTWCLTLCVLKLHRIGDDLTIECDTLFDTFSVPSFKEH